MALSTRFTVALHVLTLLAAGRGEPMTSEYIAGSVNTHPVVVRRLLALLREAGFVTSQPGNGGGWELAVNPEKLTLEKVRQAVQEESPFSMHSRQPNQRCPVGKKIQGVLGPLYVRAEKAMEGELAKTTVQSLLSAVQVAEK